MISNHNFVDPTTSLCSCDKEATPLPVLDRKPGSRGGGIEGLLEKRGGR